MALPTGVVVGLGTVQGVGGAAAGFAEANLFDGDLGTSWATSTEVGQYCGLDFGTAVPLIGAQICPRPSLNDGSLPEQYLPGAIISGSNVGINSTLTTLATLSTTEPMYWRRHVYGEEVAITGSYRYARIRNDHYGQIADLQFIITPTTGVSCRPVQPTITPSGCRVASGTAQSVTMASRTTSASIFYTTDGSDPTHTGATPTGTTLLYSGAVSVTPTAPGGFVPTDIANCELWLKADSLSLSDGQEVTTWEDGSAEGNDATAAATQKPLYKTDIINGKPALLFDGVNDRFTLGTNLTDGAFTLFIVHQTSGDSMLMSSILNNRQVRVGAGGSNIVQYFDGTNNPGANFVNARTIWGMLELKNTGTSMSFYESGNLLDPGAATATTTTELGMIGAFGNGGASNFTTGYIAEIIYFARELTKLEREKVQGYLFWKYGEHAENGDGQIGMDLPWNHTYRQAEPPATIIKALAYDANCTTTDSPIVRSGPFNIGSIPQNERWMDTEGNTIEGHSPHIRKHNGYWYKFGMFQDLTNNGGDHWKGEGGIWLYRSTDLMNWTSLGQIVGKEIWNSVERPFVFQRRTDSKWMLWCHGATNFDNTDRVVVWSADDIEGPYTLEINNLNASADYTGSLDQSVYEEGGYQYFVAGRFPLATPTNSALTIQRIADDGLSCTGTAVEISNTDLREGAVLLKQGSNYFLINSVANFLDSWTAFDLKYVVGVGGTSPIDSVWGAGPGTDLFSPDPTGTDFNFQTSCAVAVPGIGWTLWGDWWLQDYNFRSNICAVTLDFTSTTTVEAETEAWAPAEDVVRHRVHPSLRNRIEQHNARLARRR